MQERSKSLHIRRNQSPRTMWQVIRNMQAANEASYMQRFTFRLQRKKETATLTISRAAGDGATYFDDIRIIDKKIENYKEDGSFEQDFESVTSGYYPFVL